MEAGINIAPGSEDDGWVSPPPVTLADGTIVQLYKDGEALRAAFLAIEQAKHRVCLEVYIFASDATGQAFADLLCRKAKQGVRVYVIYDSFGSHESDRAMFQKMAIAGVRLQQFHPLRPWENRFSWRPFNRDHRKLLVIDDDIAGLGGLNIGAEYAGNWIVKNDAANADDFWRDNAIGLQGPVARTFLHCFAKTWHYLTHGGRIRRAEYFHNLQALAKPAEQDELSIMATVPTMNSPLRPVLHTLFNQSQKSILMTMAYFAPDDDLVNVLINAAKRGVRVRLMLPAKNDHYTLLIAARSFYDKLLSAGVEVFERQVVMVHAKTMTIDGHTTIIGSTNLDYRSIEYNLEISAIIRSETFGQQMQALFENDIHFAKRMQLKAWRRRNYWYDRFVQWVVSRARYLL